MNTGTICNATLQPFVFDGNSEYNRAIDDAVTALMATGNDGWQTVRALREPKIPLPESQKGGGE